MTNKEQYKKVLNNYSKEEIIEVLTNSLAATAFVIEQCKRNYKPKQDQRKTNEKPTHKEAVKND